MLVHPGALDDSLDETWDDDDPASYLELQYQAVKGLFEDFDPENPATAQVWGYIKKALTPNP